MKILAMMGDIKDDAEMDVQEGCKESNEEYEDYKDILIEVDDKILKFICSFKLGSILSLEVLVALADKFECKQCSALFHSKQLFKEHKENHSRSEKSVVMDLNEIDQEIELEIDFKTDIDELEEEEVGLNEPELLEKKDVKLEIGNEENKSPLLLFSCSLCDSKFLRQSWLVKHSFSHTKLNQDEYSCFHCNNVYQGNFSKQSYRKHIDRLITKEERVCDICGHLAKTMDYLETHKQVKHLGLKRFKCESDGCDKEFSKNRYLIIHTRIHSSACLKCDECDFSSNLRKNISRHKARQHFDPLTVKLNCDQCSYVAPNKERLLNHTNSCHSGIVHECAHCNKQFRRRRSYLVHIKRDHQGVRYKCENCDQEFTHKHTLVTHIRRDHEGLKLKCDHCDHEATSKRALRFHTLKTHDINPFACDICSFVASNYPFLYSHKNKIHNGVRFHCDLCEHVSYNETLLKNHMKDKHTDQEPTVYEHQKSAFDVESYPKCEPCNKLFATLRQRLFHIRKCHPEIHSTELAKGDAKNSDTESPISVTELEGSERKVISEESQKCYPKCDPCNKLFETRRKYLFHIRKCHPQPHSNEAAGESDETPIFYSQCLTCKKKFTSEKRLERHVHLNHSSVLTCSECGKTFIDKQVFINHQKWHRYSKTEAACEICGKELKRSSLMKHIQAFHSVPNNTAERTNVCHVCGKGFYIPSHLSLHMKRHNNEKDFVCTFEGCIMAFYNEFHRKDHERVHTGQSIRQCATCSKEFKSMSAYRYHIRRIHPPTF